MIPRLFLIDNQYISISKLIKINKDNKEDLLNYIMDRIGLSNEAYKSIPISSIIFSYGIRKGKIIPTIGIAQNKDIKYQTYYRNKLPIVTAPEEYGKIIAKYNNLYILSLAKNISVHLLTEKEGDHPINRIEYIKNGNILFIWKDTIISPNNFIRSIGKSTIHYKNGEVILYKIDKKTSGITKKNLPKKNQPSNKFLTMDLETILINNIHIPYLLCWSDGVKTYSYFINNLKLSQLDDNILDMVERAMKKICRKKYKDYRVYLHNFAKFDGYLLLKFLAMIGESSPVIHKGRIISTKFALKNSKYKITFMDSLLILPSSLRKLCNSFSVETIKTYFPFLLTNLNYKGEVPDIKYLPKSITPLEYAKYKESYINKIWNFKEEAIIYCSIDCIALYQILDKFNKLIFDLFKINIIKYPTLSSLAFAIFRTHFLIKAEDIPKDIKGFAEKGNIIKPIYSKIHMLSGKIANNIRQGYTGGATDMYIPAPMGLAPTKNKKIYAYDVNSLYPFVMKNFMFPIGSPTYFIGDNFKIDPSAFGFFYCKIISPLANSASFVGKKVENLLHPILQTQIKLGGSHITVSPLGTWEGMYFSEELINAKKYGYRFEILWGYTFKKGYIFKDYIDNLYSIRLQYPKNDPMNLIAKLLLNSLYGRFGMDDSFVYSEIINKKDYPKIEKEEGFTESLQDIIDLGDNYLVQLKNPKKFIKTNLDNGFETHNVNIAIAAAVTAYARIHMSQFKNNPLLPNLYYTDTDSLYFDGPIPKQFISPIELGALKLEGVYDKALFIAPKVYALQNQEELIIKIKGLTKESINKNNITIDSLELLLNKDYKLAFNQEKWFKNIYAANIQILEQIYTLEVTGNKRELIYNENNILIGTKPLKISE